MNSYLQRSTGDNALDLVASIAALAFQDAETNALARSELLSLFDPDTLTKLHRLHLITWDPATVRELPAQMELEMAL